MKLRLSLGVCLKFGLVFLLLLKNVFHLGAQEDVFIEETSPKYKLIGDITQTLGAFGDTWTSGNALWTLQVDLKHELTLGPVAFIADHNIIALPLSINDIKMQIWEAYIRLIPCADLDITLGQKRFNIGTGQSFTVGDSFNPLTNFFDEKIGFRGVALQWAPTHWFNWGISLNVERNLGYDRWNLSNLHNSTRTKTNLDPSLLAFATQTQFLLNKWQIIAALVASPDRTFNPSLGLSYDLYGIILTAEGACEWLSQYKQPESNKPFTQWSARSAWSSPVLSGSSGARFSLAPITDIDLTFSAEYLYWGQGWNKEETQIWLDALHSFSMTTALKDLRSNLFIKGQHNAFFKASFSGWQTINLNGMIIVDLQDASLLSQLVLTYFVFEGFDLLVTWQSSQGKANSAWQFLSAAELGNPIWICNLQARYHF